MSLDQAASLRAWALEKARDAQHAAQGVALAPGVHDIVVAGLPVDGDEAVRLVRARLERWADLGFRWAGDPEQWRVNALDGSGDLPERAARSRRWALWVDTDIRAFRKGYEALGELREHGAPSRVLALHEPGLSRKGLLDNLSRLAAAYFDIELVVLSH